LCQELKVLFFNAHITFFDSLFKRESGETLKVIFSFFKIRLLAGLANFYSFAAISVFTIQSINNYL